MVFPHIPVLLNEVIDFLAPQKNQNFIDCTLGTGGHAEAILMENGPRGKLLAIDLDEEALKLSTKRLEKYKNRVIFVQENFKNIKRIVYEYKFDQVDGVLLDLGLSSLQLGSEKRGFSFQKKGSLDMRFAGLGEEKGNLTAYKIINFYSEKELEIIFKEFGEEKFSKSIARNIVRFRKEKPIIDTFQLVEIIRRSVPGHYLHKKIHPATRIFQALRIVVNRELENLAAVLPQIIEILKPGGRLAVISYHSLEDRIVKQLFKREAKDCLCPPQLPICQCGHKAQIKILTPKVIRPKTKEILINPRSRSAKMRVVEKI